MMQGAKDLLASERGVFAVLLVLTITLLVVLGKLTGQDWLAFAKWIAITLIASKTITGVVETNAQKTTPTP